MKNQFVRNNQDSDWFRGCAGAELITTVKW